MKISIAANTAWYITNFRLNLARALVKAGYEVICIAPPDKYVRKIEYNGIRFLPLPMDNKGTNPIKDIILLCRLIKILYREKPQVYLGNTVKPNIYGGFACKILGIQSIHNIAGLGTTFITNSLLTKIVSLLYKLSLRNRYRVYFQNKDDLALFLDHKMVAQNQVELLPGSGVDTEWFKPNPQKQNNHSNTLPFRFLLLGRLLWDKGIKEYVEAARILFSKNKHIECLLLGFIETPSPSAIPRNTILAWHTEGIIRFLGSTDDVRPIVSQTDCVVLPSYREGTPRCLLEAASMGKPVITTDVPGCRQVVDDKKTGYLCRVQDVQDLAEKMLDMILLSDQERFEMGLTGREKIVREFSEQTVIGRYLVDIKKLNFNHTIY